MPHALGIQERLIAYSFFVMALRYRWMEGQHGADVQLLI